MDQTTATKLLQRHKTYSAAARAAGVSRRTFCRMLNKIEPMEGLPKARKPTGMLTRVMVSEIRRKADPVEQVINYVKMKACIGQLVHESELRGRLGIGERRWRRIIKDRRLAKCTVVLKDINPNPDGLYIGREQDVRAARAEHETARWL